MRQPRILLLEFLTTDRLYQYRGELFPFVRGYAVGEGLPVRWLSFGYRPADAAGDRFRLALHGAARTALLDTARSFRPTHVLASQQLAPPLEAALSEAAPDARVSVYKLSPDAVDLERVGNLRAWLGLPDDDARQLVDVAAPDYACELADDLARRIRPMVPVVLGPVCLYGRSLARNPHFEGIDLARAHRPVGCSFCGERDEPRYPYRSPAETLALAQIRAAVATLPAERWSGDFLLTGSAAFLRLERLCEAVLAEALPPLALYFYCRIDEARQKAEAIDALLPRLDAAGHAIHLFAMGVENFSPIENERFNKGITEEDVAVTFERLERWERAWPRAFRFHAEGGFSFILFTPWTTLADLRHNLREAERYRFPAKPFFFTSRLQLFERRPITLLAERDGVLQPAFEDPAFAAFDSGCITEEGQVELPWRFLQPEVGAVYGVCIRLWPLPGISVADPLFQRVQTLVRRLPPDPRALYHLFGALLDAAAQRPGDPSSEALIGLIGVRPSHWTPTRRCPVGGSDPSPPGMPWEETMVAKDAALVARLQAILDGGDLAPDERDAAPGDGAGPLDPLLRYHVACAREILRRLEERGGDTLHGLVPQGVDALPGGAGWGQLRVTLRDATGPLRLYFSPASAPVAWRKGARFALSFDEDTPLSTPARRHAADLLLRAMERATAQAPPAA